MSLGDRPSGAEAITLTPAQEVQAPPSQDHTKESTSVEGPRSQSVEGRNEDYKTDRAVTVPPKPPKHRDRFRAAVRKVIAVRRTSSAIVHGRRGAEPGADPRRRDSVVAYNHVYQKCLIDVIDYSSIRCSFGRMTSSGFIRFLQNDQASAREPWVKVRWINVGGISWDVISALALKYDMHPLSVEDVLFRGGHALSKADYYPNHLFIRVLCHTLGGSTHYTSQGSKTTAGLEVLPSSPQLTGLPRSTSPLRLDEKHGQAEEVAYPYQNFCGDDIDLMADEFEMGKATPVDPEIGYHKASLLARRRGRAAAKLTLDELKKEDRVNVHIEPMCIFLFPDGTVISFHSRPNLDLTEPIAKRVRQQDTSLRRTADPSLLVQSLLDLTVDAALEVVDEYRTRINVLERFILIKSKASIARSLHILSGDLILHKRTLGPVKALIYALRNYDKDRTAASLDVPMSENRKVVGYMSHKAKIYLADVYDHMEYAMTSLDMYSAIAENLINYSFNMASYEMNEVMRRLTLCTILFLPLTLLTGYFGMNFENMWSIHHGHTDIIFWYIAIPVISIVAPAFMWPDIVRVYHYFKKRSLARKIGKRFKTE